MNFVMNSTILVLEHRVAAGGSADSSALGLLSWCAQHARQPATLMVHVHLMDLNVEDEGV